jgi:hypothetical protein
MPENKKMVFHQPFIKERYPDDVKKIIASFLELNMNIDSIAAQQAWEAYSESFCAGWMIMTGMSSIGIVDACMPYLVEENFETL